VPGSFYAGVDVGSVSTAAVVVDRGGSRVGHSIAATGARCAHAAEQALGSALEGAGLEPGSLSRVVSTGYGRDRVASRHATVTELTCHARGIGELAPDTRLLLDVGGQDSKAMLLGPSHRVADFALNDRCAAGTGRFFENMCRVLEIDLDAFGSLAALGDGRVTISHVCAVFAESEVVGLLAQGTPREDIAAALCRGAAAQVAGLAKRVGLRAPVALSGGVACNSGFARALSDALGTPIAVPEHPDLVGAFGAALIAREQSA
jgi:predicted CoA-substrate-specific enzyme activase